MLQSVPRRRPLGQPPKFSTTVEKIVEKQGAKVGNTVYLAGKFLTPAGQGLGNWGPGRRKVPEP
jgi:hypothetical protein